MDNSLPFCKFDGAGNDFVLVDFRAADPGLTQRQVAHLCHRRFGIGADGLMSLHRASEGYDFEMRYYNSDGRLGSMCGNGGRCIAVYAYLLGLGQRNEAGTLCRLHFLGPDGAHDAEVLLWNAATGVGLVRLGMRSVACDEVRRCLDGWFLDTGSPHYVQRVQDLQHFDVVGEGRRIRNMADLFPEGTNVDFIEDSPDGSLFVRTFERGVEDETWACGTGVTASAIVSGNGRIHTLGGDFKVTFSPTGKTYEDVTLTGPVAYNFKGEVILPIDQ